MIALKFDSLKIFAIVIIAGSSIASTAPQGPALPLPPQPFSGVIAPSQQDSKPSFPAPVRAPAGAPNVFLIMTDDVGFGAASTFGGPIPTPNLTRLAERGLIYNRFHTTAMCSPTRAALLTGRNHHAVGNGTVANLSTGYPGYISVLPRSAATIAQILGYSGYSTAMLGKHHNTPETNVSPAGPFDMWPTRLGFDHFFGFLAAETNQFTPALYRDQQSVPTIKEGVLDKALADDAINWVHAQKAVDPAKPFFLYLATASTHGPLQAPADWIAKFRGKFDAGWDTVRTATIERQKEAGLIPQATDTTARPQEIPAWSSLSPKTQAANARMMEVYAAMLSYQDEQFGRILDEIDRMGEADNTLVIFIEGDNGAAAEAGLNGSSNPMARFANSMVEVEDDLYQAMDSFGGSDSNGNYASGWAWAMNAPYPLVKRHASHLGGVRNGMVVSWPSRIAQRGTRSQFTHVTDIMPTILEAAQIQAPISVDGVPQQPVDGVSIMYSFANPNATERHTTQYFEMLGNRAIYHQGWWASTAPGLSPWLGNVISQPDATKFEWELYNLEGDFAQAHNLAAQWPAKLAEMQTLFDTEARQNQVYPLDARLSGPRFAAATGQKIIRDRYTYWGMNITIPAHQGPPILNKAFTLTAIVELSNGKTNGTIAALGSKFGGWSFRMIDGKPAVTMAASQMKGDQSTIVSPVALPFGRHKIEYQFLFNGKRNGGGEMIVRVDGKIIVSGQIARTISQLPEQTDSFDVGYDADTPVVSGVGGGAFEGKILRLDVVPAR